MLPFIGSKPVFHFISTKRTRFDLQVQRLSQNNIKNSHKSLGETHARCCHLTLLIRTVRIATEAMISTSIQTNHVWIFVAFVSSLRRLLPVGFLCSLGSGLLRSGRSASFRCRGRAGIRRRYQTHSRCLSTYNRSNLIFYECSCFLTKHFSYTSPDGRRGRSRAALCFRSSFPCA